MCDPVQPEVPKAEMPAEVVIRPGLVQINGMMVANGIVAVMLPQPKFRQVVCNVAPTGEPFPVRFQQLHYDHQVRVGEWRDVVRVNEPYPGAIPNPDPFYG